MRFMEISPFPRKMEIVDLDDFVRSLLTQESALWSNQGVALLGYMGWPNDPEARKSSVDIIHGWDVGSTIISPRFLGIQIEWLRIADIFHLHYDLTRGGHQSRRGGPSIGKAIELVATISQAKGTGRAQLWDVWAKHKDVAHLITAAIIITRDARKIAKVQPFGSIGPRSQQLNPFQIAILMPDFVLSIALSFQEYGLGSFPHGHDKPMLDPETLWHINPADMNIQAVEPPFRAIVPKWLSILNARRAGNRGKGSDNGPQVPTPTPAA